MPNELRVYLTAPFGKSISSQPELDLYLKDKLFVSIIHDNFAVTKASLREQIQGAQELFYYQFVSKVDGKPMLTERVIKRVEFVQDRAELSPDIYYFVFYDPAVTQQKSYFVVEPELSSDALNEAIDLATTIIRGNETTTIMLNCDASGSTVKDVQIEFMDRQPMAITDQTDVSTTCSESVTALFFYPYLIDLAASIGRDNPGYKRLVLFLSATMVHYNRAQASLSSTVLDMTESGASDSAKSKTYVEERLLSGLMDLTFGIDSHDELKLTLTADANNPVTLLSSTAPVTTIENSQLDVVEFKVVHQIWSDNQDPDRLSVKFKVSLTNRSKRVVCLPTHVLPLHSLNLTGFLLKEDGSRIRLAKRCCKFKSMGLYESSPLEVGQSREYELSDLNNAFSFESNSKYEIHLKFHIKVCFSGIPYHFTSNENVVVLSWTSHEEKKNGFRMSLRPLCQLANVRVN